MISKNKIFLFLFCLFFLFANFCFVSATNGIQEDDSGEVKFIPQIGIPGSEFEAGKKIQISGKSFIEYMTAIYKWSVGAIAIIAIVMIMIAGFQWMTAAGNASAIGQAKSRISSSLIGLLLAIGAYSILNFVNPSLVNLRTLDLGNIDYVDLVAYKLTCNGDGQEEYTWPYHHCFTMGHNDWTSEFFPMSDFFIGSDIHEVFKSENIDSITFRYGVDKLQTNDCDANGNFSKIAKTSPVRLGPAGASTALCHGSFENLYFEEAELYQNLGADSAGIFIKPKINDNHLSGFYIEVGNKSPGEASAFIANIKVTTNKFCVSCCKKTISETSMSYIMFLNTVDCSSFFAGDLAHYAPANPQECCSRYADISCEELAGYSDDVICNGLEEFCDRCHWDKVNDECNS